MAKRLLKFPYSFIFLSVFITYLAITTAKSHNFSRIISPKALGLKREKLSHLHFYFHDKVNGRHTTAVRVARSTKTNESLTEFGLVVVMDDPLTIQPKPTSKLVGRAQGIYASDSQTEINLLMVLTFAFTEGKYNGSTLSILGRDSVFSGFRETPIVGGSGLFRFARGYAVARTHHYGLNFGSVVVEYNVYVFHY